MSDYTPIPKAELDKIRADEHILRHIGAVPSNSTTLRLLDAYEAAQAEIERLKHG